MRKRWNEFQPHEGTLMFQFKQKLNYIKEQVKTWNKDHFGDMHLEKNE